jgi:glucose/mannose-6-phosphate isomerase
MPAATTTETSLGADMFQSMATYVRDYKDAYAAARLLAMPSPSQFDNVILTGMGGSGIGADLVTCLLQPNSPKPIFVVKDYRLPRWVSARSFVIATSYSGNTEETLACVADARERGALLAGITSGGHLATFLGRNNLSVFHVPTARQPRAALPILFGGLAGMLDRVGIGKLELDPSDENILQNLHVQLQPKLSGTEDRALRFAERVRNAQPTIVGEAHLWPVAMRWKAQLNENSKIFARAEQLPEMNHNDLVPWSQAPKQPTDSLILLRRQNEPKEIAARFGFLAEVAQGEGVPVETITAVCRTAVGQCLEHILYADYTSVYTAVLRHVDPSPVAIIARLKQRLERDGMASDVRKRLGL